MTVTKERDDPAAVWVDVEDIRSLPTPNPRLNDSVVPKVADSIKRFGFGAPLVLTKSLKLIAGDTRLKAARQLGLKRVPARLLDLTDQEATTLRAGDNRLGQLAEWNYALLADDLRGLSEDDLDVTGFSKEDVARMAPLSEDEFHPSSGNDPNDPDAGAKPIAMTVAQREVFDRAARKIRKEEGDGSIPDGRICELLAADWLGGN